MERTDAVGDVQVWASQPFTVKKETDKTPRDSFVKADFYTGLDGKNCSLWLCWDAEG
jgi:hypothetical protein